MSIYFVIKWRMALPVSMGLVSAGLLAWERHNSDVIDSMGMAWDTGAPMWPYQTPEIILALLNAPAYLLAAPLWIAFDLRLQDQRAPVLLLAIVLFWLGVGCILDFEVLDCFRRRFRKAFTIWLSVFALTALIAGVGAVASSLHWWSNFGAWSLGSVLIFARIAAVAPWSFFLAIASVRTLIQGWKMRSDPLGTTMAEE